MQVVEQDRQNLTTTFLVPKEPEQALEEVRFLEPGEVPTGIFAAPVAFEIPASIPL
jgi:hypothetical protein